MRSNTDETTKKQITFDLDTTASGLQYFYKGTRSQAYNEIARYLDNIGFEHTADEGSVYQSKTAIRRDIVYQFLDQMLVDIKWLRYCLKDSRVTQIPDERAYYTNAQRLQEQEKYFRQLGIPSPFVDIPKPKQLPLNSVASSTQNLDTGRISNSSSSNAAKVTPAKASTKHKDYDDEYTR